MTVTQTKEYIINGLYITIDILSSEKKIYSVQDRNHNVLVNGVSEAEAELLADTLLEVITEEQTLFVK